MRNALLDDFIRPFDYLSMVANEDHPPLRQPDQELALRDKTLFLGDSIGRVQAFTVEEVFARELNHWTGWHCAIGVETLHITSDGNVFGGACRNTGFLGNVYDYIQTLPTEWHQCTRKSCFCGEDMQVRKAKNVHLKKWTSQDATSLSIISNLSDPAFVTPVHQSIHKQYPLAISWDLGRRCNYSCSYCYSGVSNNFEAYKTWGSLMYAYKEISREFLKGRKSKFTFTGGEPTINPKYMDYVKFLKEQGHIVHTTTNGSRSPDYFSELIEHSFIGFSYHFEFATKDHFVEVLKSIINKKKDYQEAKNNWCGVRIMVPPNHLEQAKDLHRSLKEIEGFVEQEIMLSMSPLFEPGKASNMINYPEGELNEIARLS